MTAIRPPVSHVVDAYRSRRLRLSLALQAHTIAVNQLRIAPGYLSRDFRLLTVRTLEHQALTLAAIHFGVAVPTIAIAHDLLQREETE